MEEIIFEWRDKTIVTTNNTDKKIELVNITENTSSIRCFFCTENTSNSNINTLNTYQEN